MDSAGKHPLVRAGFAGPVVLPGDADYDEARRVWNAMIDRRPQVVARATGARDVAAAIAYARAEGLSVAVRGGGHSIPGHSTCDGGIVIDLREISAVEVDAGRRRARVGGGALLGALDAAAQEAGLVCPVGVVSHTGVGGLTLGGGMGRLQRRLGLTIDSLEAVELVTAEGEAVRASAEENADLFWALRGAGANFGVATAFEFRLHPLDPEITSGFVVYPLARAAELAAVFRELCETGSDDLMPTFALGRAEPAELFPPEIAGREVTFASVRYYGSEAGAERELAPLRALGRPALDTIGRTSYLAAQTASDDAMRWGYRYYIKSELTSSFDDAIVTACAGHLPRAPRGGECSISVWPWGRAIADVGEDETAFTGRGAASWVAIDSVWTDPARDHEYRDWVRAVFPSVEQFRAGGRYVNDQFETGADVVRAVYGEAKYERLVATKRRWDPENVFRLNQNVKP